MCTILIMLSAMYASCPRANSTSYGLSTLAAMVQLPQRNSGLLVWFQHQSDFPPEVVAPDLFLSAGLLLRFWWCWVRNLRTHSSQCIIPSIYPLFGPFSLTLLLNISAIDRRCAFCTLRGTSKHANPDLVAFSTSRVGGCMPCIVWKAILCCLSLCNSVWSYPEWKSITEEMGFPATALGNSSALGGIAAYSIVN